MICLTSVCLYRQDQRKHFSVSCKYKWNVDVEVCLLLIVLIWYYVGVYLILMCRFGVMLRSTYYWLCSFGILLRSTYYWLCWHGILLRSTYYWLCWLGIMLRSTYYRLCWFSVMLRSTYDQSLCWFGITLRSILIIDCVDFVLCWGLLSSDCVD